MELIKELILQLAFIFIPLLLYHSLWLSKQIQSSIKPNQFLFLTLILLSALLCLTYPIRIETLLPITLVTIPLMVSFFYGGYQNGIIVLISILLYTFIIQPYTDVHLYYIASYSLILIFITNKWKKMKKRLRYVTSFFIGCIPVVLLYLFETTLHGHEFPELESKLVIISIFISISSLLTISVIEYIIENVRLRMRLIQSEKMSVVSELAASVAHEVRNPLTVVRGFIQLMDRKNGDKESEYTKLILSELDRAQEIISDYLNLAKQEYIEKESLHFSKMIEEVSTLMLSYAHLKNIKLETSIQPSLFVYGDEYKLKQVFINLIKNAIEATEDGNGKVVIEAYDSKDSVRVKIIDNGEGMSQEQLQRLGEPFYSLKEKGTGLGLMVAYSIIDLHNGHIQFQSTIHKGTTVRVSIPKTDETRV
ncbi:sensor histidine kinase [Bacillus kexueae]|uniref:sensor histidine kinase n=1 Tax=Aeribacillus kexueae TaxID=2078952 RepID=UPI001FAF3A2C|nr:HAMP domain-containing sensor histidine kinase [Bacillus kexueae]